MGKIKKILENELVGGTQGTDVYPVTSIKAVYDERNDRLDQILNRKSHIGYITAPDYTCIICTDKTIEFGGFFDIFFGSKFYRVGGNVSPQTIDIPDSGSGVIYLNQDTMKFGITSDENLLYNCIELGRVFKGSIISIYGKYTYNNVRYNYGTPIASSDVDYDNDTFPMTQKQVILCSKYTTVARGKVSINNSTVTLGAGNYYFYPRIGNIEKSITLESPLTFTLGNDNVLAADLQNLKFIVKDKKSVNINEVICLFKDAVAGICDGLWISPLCRNDIESIKHFYSKFDLGTVDEHGDIESVYIPVAKGDNVTIASSSYEKTIYAPFMIYDSNYKELDRWVIPGSNNFSRTINISHENAAFMKLRVSTDSTYPQYIVKNEEIVFSWGNINNNIIAPVAMIVRGLIMKKGNSITINSGDFYVSAIKNLFYRVESPITITTSRSSGGIWYNYKTKTVSIRDYAAENEAMLGVTDDFNIFLNGQYTVTDADSNEVYYNYISSNTIRDMSHGISTIPPFVFDSGQKTYQRLMDWCGNESNVFLLAQVTDVHSGGSTKYKVVGWLNSLNSLFNFNVLGNFGDIGLDTSYTNSNKEATYALVNNTKAQMSTNSPWIFLKGNHEKIEENGISSNNVYGNIFNKASRRVFPQLSLSQDGNYGYLDDSNTMTRVILLNTTDIESGTGYRVSITQLQWLINTINGTPDNYKIIVTSHLCIDDIGRWKSYPNDAAGDNFDTLRSILSGIANHTRGSNSATNLSWDFTKKLNVKLVCSMAGDSHFNNYIKRDGVNYIVRQGYGGIDNSEVPEGGTLDSFNWESVCNFDVLAVKQDGNAKVFRIGIGGESRDLAFTF